MKIVVSGGSGLIGFKLVEALVAEGQKVKVLSRPDGNCNRLKNIGAECRAVDIRDKASISGFLEDADCLIHLAALHLGECKKADLWSTNVEGTRNLLEASFEKGVKKFIHCSSVAVMGYDLGDKAVDESYRENKLVDDYQRTKLEAEMLVKSFAKKGLNTVIIRPSHVYGPGSLRFYRWILKIYYQRKLSIIGDGKNTLHLVYIDDLIEAFKKALCSERALGKEYTIAAKENISLENFLKHIFTSFGLKSEIRRIPTIVSKNMLKRASYLLSMFFPNSFALSACRLKPFLLSENYDITRAKVDFGYEPKIDYPEGIRNTVNWLKENNFLAKGR